jgi:predicted DsbA family dithiol-disulfide isomerase
MRRDSRPGKGLLVFVLAAVVFALGTAGPALADFYGSYQRIAALPKKHSVKVVQFDEFLNFTCPHCNNFREAAKPLKKKYGKRLKVTYIPVLFRGQPDSPLRLFYIGEAAGRTEEIKNLIFDAAFVHGVNIYDPTVVSYLARSSGLGERYQKEGGAEWVTQKVLHAQRRAEVDGIRATPTVVLQRALLVEPAGGMQAYVGNLERLIEQLLSK